MGNFLIPDDEPPDITARLKTVEEHNEMIRKSHRLLEEAAKKTGVACPKCSNEMEWAGPLRMFPVCPPLYRQLARCSGCGFTVELER